MAEKFKQVDDYIASFPAEVQLVLEELRARVHAAAPGIAEAISYDIASFRLDDRPLVHVAGWKHHVSIYPVPAGDRAFERELAPYRSGQGTLKFSLNDPLPLTLIDRIFAQHVVRCRQG